MWTFLVSLGLSALFGIAQTSSFIIFFGVKPNLILALILAYALLERDWLRRSAITLIGLVLISFGPGVSLFAFYVAVVFFLAQALVDFLPWQPMLSAAIALFTATLLINLEQFTLTIFAWELLFNLIVWLILFALLRVVKKRYQTNYA